MKSTITSLSRRQFLKLTGFSGAGLIVASSVSMVPAVWAQSGQTDSTGLNLFISINDDNSVSIICHRSEMGQGIRTGLPQVVAEELCADWHTVKVVQGQANKAYGSQNTDGSRSIRRFYTTMREMGATARMQLEHAAANKWQVDVADVYADLGFVHQRNGSRKASFASLAEKAASLPIPDNYTLTLKSPDKFSLIGKDLDIVDMDAMITGSAEFGQDVQLDDMVFASIERSPVVGGKVDSYDKKAALAVKGVLDVIEMPEQGIPVNFSPFSGVAVIASNSWSAMQGRKKLNIQWLAGEHSEHDSKAYLNDLSKRVKTKGKVIREQGDAYQELEKAQSTLEATYEVPYLAHAPMEPPAATAIVNEDKCEVWACTQTPQSTQTNVAQRLGLKEQDVIVNVTLLGGGFGRKSKPDYSIEAALLARQLKKPVKVIWSREDDIRNGFYHAVSAQHFVAGLTGQQVNTWIQRTAFPSISWTFTGTVDEPQEGELSLGFADVPFNIRNLSCESHKAEGHVRIGWVRSVSNIQHAFAQGSFVDEIAHKLQLPPHKMWHQLIGADRHVNPSGDEFNYSNYGESLEEFPLDTQRLKHVLDMVISNSGADKALPDGEGWGISVHRSFVSYVAVASKVRVGDGKLRVLEMHSAIDAGTVVNPDRVRAQQEGSMIFGLSIALLGEITVENGAIAQSNYNDYQVLRIHQCPDIYTYIVESDKPPGGVGEPGTPPVAASIANAIFHASGQRIRSLPIKHHLQV